MPDGDVSAKLRHASCQCGQLQAVCRGEPIRISVCHCLACQKRSGGPFGAQARFVDEDVTITGEARQWTRIADSGDPVDYHFCPDCGSVVWYRSRPLSHAVAIPIGAFADPDFPTPQFSVYESRRHTWVSLAGDDIEHHD